MVLTILKRQILFNDFLGFIIKGINLYLLFLSWSSIIKFLPKRIKFLNKQFICTVHAQGISFADLMYVTKRNMANAVSSMTKHLEQVQSSLAVSTYSFLVYHRNYAFNSILCPL